MAEPKFEIKSHVFTLGERKGQYQKELNIVSWYDKEPTYDLRGWNEDHSKMTKGVTLSEAEFNELKIKIQEVQ